jgi:hypothetical protein
MNAEARSLQGVSGSGTLPDQGAVRLAATADKTERQSCEDKKKARQLRVYLPDSQAKRWLSLPPSERSRAVAAVLGGVDASIDLHRLIDATTDLRRLGVLLNQAVRLAHQDRTPLDFVERVEAVVRAVEALRP